MGQFAGSIHSNNVDSTKNNVNKAKQQAKALRADQAQKLADVAKIETGKLKEVQGLVVDNTIVSGMVDNKGRLQGEGVKVIIDGYGPDGLNFSHATLRGIFKDGELVK